MRKSFLLIFLVLLSQVMFAGNEVGPEGHKLLWIFLVIVLVTVAFFFTTKPFKKKGGREKKPVFQNRRVNISLEKDALYYPDKLTLTVKNTGNSDLDIDQPLLVFDNFWLRRKFRIKGMENHSFYPLYLEKGKSHTLQIDLGRFYGHDKSLKKFPKAKIILTDIKGKRLGSKSVFLRKTLFKF